MVRLKLIVYSLLLISCTCSLWSGSWILQ